MALYEDPSYFHTTACLIISSPYLSFLLCYFLICCMLGITFKELMVLFEDPTVVLFTSWDLQTSAQKLNR